MWSDRWAMRAWVRSRTSAVDSEMPIYPATLRNIVNSAEASSFKRGGKVT
jgi:hypothetical protein